MGTGYIGLSNAGKSMEFYLPSGKNTQDGGILSFFALKAKDEKGHCSAGTLGSFSDYKSDYKDENFCTSDFSVEFPYARFHILNDEIPGKISVLAYSPFILFNDIDSSIPAAFFEFEIENNTEETIDYSVCLALKSPFGESNNTFDGDVNNEMKCIWFRSDFGEDMCIATDSEYVSYKETAESFNSVFSEFKNAEYFDNCRAGAKEPSFGLICSHHSLCAGKKEKARFIISWYMPYFDNKSEKNYYAKFFDSSKECASYCFSHWQRLHAETSMFTDNFYSSTLPFGILNAVGESLCAFKSFKYARDKNEKFYFDVDRLLSHGAQYAPAYLFPKIQRNIFNLYKDRCAQGAFLDKSVHIDMIRSTYREFRMYADKSWLFELWPCIKKSFRAVFDEASEKSDSVVYELLGIVNFMAAILKDRPKIKEYSALMRDMDGVVFENVAEEPDNIYDKASFYISEDYAFEGVKMLNCESEKRSGVNPFLDFCDKFTAYGLINASNGLSYNLYENSVSFKPATEFSDRTGTYKSFFALSGAQGFVETGPDYIQMKLLSGNLNIRRFGLHKIPRKVYYGGRNIGFEADGNTAVLDNVLPFNVKKDIMVIFD